MTIEEKAKAYDEAIEKIKYVMEHGVSPVLNKEDLQGIFPELAESEDKEIRQAMINFFKSERIKDGIAVLHFGVNIEKMIAWLEKQGEQKATDTVEPKFKVGTWIISKYMHLVMQILNNDIGCYKTVETDGTERYDSYDFIERNLKLWTIQDAKDGDVLVYNNSAVEIILLFKKWMNGVGDGAYSYAHTFNNEILFNNWSDCGYTAHPATKEQRDLLFQKMHEAGYEWDADKKELKGLEKQAPKTKWSEEDAFRTKTLTETVIGGGSIRFEMRNEYVDWLKSLKQRLGGEE